LWKVNADSTFGATPISRLVELTIAEVYKVIVFSKTITLYWTSQATEQNGDQV
jgi:hypothetical protein